MFKKIHWFMCIVCLVILVPIRGVQAQESRVLKITAENAAQLVQRHDIRLNLKGVEEVLFTPDSKTLFIYSKSSLLRFDMATGKAMKPLVIKAASLRDMTVSADGITLAYVNAECSPGNCTSKIVLLDMQTGKESHTFSAAGFSDGLALNAEGSLLAYSDNKTKRVSQANQVGTALGPSAIHIVDLKTGKEQQLIEEKDGILGHLFISPDSTQLAYNSMEWKTINGGLGSGKLHYIELLSGKEIRVLSTKYLVKTISPDWRMGYISPSVELPGFITFSAATPLLLGLENGELIGELTGVQDLVFDPDSALYAATGVVDGGISLHRVDSRKEIVQLPIKRAKHVFRPLFSPDGSLFASVYRTADDNFYLSVWGIGKATKS